MEPVTLSGGDLLLSPPGPDDVDVITAACQDPDIAAWTTVPSPYSSSDAEYFLEHLVAAGWASGAELTWAIRQPAAPERLLGMVGLHGVADGSAEIGYWAAPWARGRGVMTTAAGLVVDHAFDPGGLDLVRVSWQAYVGNWPSRRVAWRVGFRVEGTLRLHAVQRGVRRDSWFGSLLRDDPRGPAGPWPSEAPRQSGGAEHVATVPPA